MIPNATRIPNVTMDPNANMGSIGTMEQNAAIVDINAMELRNQNLLTIRWLGLRQADSEY